MFVFIAQIYFNWQKNKLIFLNLSVLPVMIIGK